MAFPESEMRLAAEALAAHRDGLLNRRELRAVGVGQATLARAVRSGRWARLQRDVYAVPVPAEVPFGLLLQAALRSQGCGVVAGDAAACWWGLAGADEAAARHAVELVLPTQERRMQRPGVALSWRQLQPEEISRRRGIPVTTVPRTLADLAQRQPGDQVLALVDSALRLGLATRAEIDRPVPASSARRHPGLRALSLGDARAESVFESRARWMLLAAGLPPPQLQVDVTGADGRWIARVDLAWPQRRVAVELDGFATHGSPGALRHDLARQNAILAAGWQLLRFTWADLDGFVAVVASALGRTRAVPTTR